MKELNTFREFLNEAPAYDMGDGTFEVTQYVQKNPEGHWVLNNDAIARYIKSQTYNDDYPGVGTFTPDNRFIQDIMSFDDFTTDLEGITNSFIEYGENALSEPEIEKVIDQAVNFYLGKY